MNDSMAADLIRLKIMELGERQPFGPNAYNNTPYTRKLAELAATYGVPCITDTNDPSAKFVPQIPEGKVKNG